MAGNDCAASVQVCRLRVARLGGDGVPDPGANNLYITDAMIRLTTDPQISEGEDIEQKNGCGALLVQYKTPDAYKFLNVELELATPDPELLELIGGGTLLTLGGQTRGHMFPALRTPFNENGVSLEAWSKAIVDGQLDDLLPYWRTVLPKVYNWRIGQRELANGNMGTVLSGQAINNANWYDGPANDWYTLADQDVTGPLAMARDNDMPDANCGYLATAAS